jgi:hypothetical protein
VSRVIVVCSTVIVSAGLGSVVCHAPGGHLRMMKPEIAGIGQWLTDVCQCCMGWAQQGWIALSMLKVALPFRFPALPANSTSMP